MFHSEPFSYSAFDYARGYTLFPSRLRLMRAVNGGMFVGTENEIFFLKGKGPKDFEQDKVSDHPLLIGGYSLNKVDGRNLGDGKTFFGECIVLVNTEGVYIGGQGLTGVFTPITEDKITLLEHQSASVHFDETSIIITLQ